MTDGGFDEFDYDVFDENDLIELVQHVSASQARGGTTRLELKGPQETLNPVQFQAGGLREVTNNSSSFQPNVPFFPNKQETKASEPPFISHQNTTSRLPSIEAKTPLIENFDDFDSAFDYDLPVDPPILQDNPAFDSMQARMEALQTEVSALRSKVVEAEETAQARLGEVLILRTKLNTASKQGDDRAAQLEQQLKKLELRHQSEVDSLYADRERIAANNRFLEHEIASNANRARTRIDTTTPAKVHQYRTDTQRPIPPPELPDPVQESATETSRISDGFIKDEETVLHAVPGQQIPRKSAKRKRTSISTVPPADLESGFAGLELALNSSIQLFSPGSQSHRAFLESMRSSDYSTFLRNLVTYRTPNNWCPFETLMSIPLPKGHYPLLKALNLPPYSSKTVGSVLLDGIPPYRPDSLQASHQRWLQGLANKVCIWILDLWMMCLEMQYHYPVRSLVSLLHHHVLMAGESLRPGLSKFIECATRTITSLVDGSFPTPETSPIFEPSGIPEGDVLRLQTKLSLELRMSASPVLSVVRALCTLVSLQAQSHHDGPSDAEPLMSDSPNTRASLTSHDLIWTSVSPEFILDLLDPKQHVDTILLTLDILRRSVTPNGFGPILSNEKESASRQHETDLLDRLFFLLFAAPAMVRESANLNSVQKQGLPPRSTLPQPETTSKATITFLRLSVIRLLSAIGTSRHGIHAIANNLAFLPSIFTFLSSTLLEIYNGDWRRALVVETGSGGLREGGRRVPKVLSSIPGSTFQKIARSAGNHGRAEVSRDLLYILLNSATKLAYMIIMQGGLSPQDIREIITANLNSSTPTTSREKYNSHNDHLVSLSRIAFSDQIWIDAGICTEATEAAHQLLDEYLSPEEGASLLEVFLGSSADV